ncbi:tRNA-2-methylthio-N(6)-dimethylallyladenosine synthase [Quillaja saponaria]|uniref:tRNA-2-methylthio-N(6)-dimethylallyladenosine synthase n=1 Tax=Quillaja saponaria TaxID=32244 RepID=A0AAD7M3Y3_QUISA|nr:tRNA-2-methylthio-N(6)-dimethylallyladenosine synthase [Quillaja saponaria]
MGIEAFNYIATFGPSFRRPFSFSTRHCGSHWLRKKEHGLRTEEKENQSTTVSRTLCNERLGIYILCLGSPILDISLHRTGDVESPKPPPPNPNNRVASPDAKKDTVAISASSSKVPVVQTNEVNFRIQQARNFAVAQAQQDGCTGNYRIFDSPFGNFLVPVLPTRAELLG